MFFVCDADDGISPERVAQVMGQPDHCHHAVHIINELIQTAQVCFAKYRSFLQVQKQLNTFQKSVCSCFPCFLSPRSEMVLEAQWVAEDGVTATWEDLGDCRK